MKTLVEVEKYLNEKIKKYNSFKEKYEEQGETIYKDTCFLLEEIKEIKKDIFGE